MLVVIQTDVACHQMGDGHDNSKEGESLSAEQFQGKQEGCDRAVDYAAEDRNQRGRRTEACRQPQKRSDYTAKVEPTKKTGTISPPLKPEPKATAVNSSFSRNAPPNAEPPMAASTMCMPAPL